MAANPVRQPPLQFDLFELDPNSLQLRRSGLPVDLPPQALRILLLLTTRPNDLVTRKEIKDALWPGQSYGDFDSRLNFAIKKLREALDDDAERPRYVQTVRNAGYRFIAPLQACPNAVTNMPPTITPGPAPANSIDGRFARVFSSGLLNQRPLLLGFVLGVAALGLAQRLLNLHPKPVIERVSAIEAKQEQQIRIIGHGLGRHAPFTTVGLDSPDLMVGDDTAYWMAGLIDADRVSEVTVLIQDWSDTLITIKGFSGLYGQGDATQGNWKLHPGDRVRIRVWNPQHENAGFDECVVTVGAGEAVCSK